LSKRWQPKQLSEPKFWDTPALLLITASGPPCC
jgi:hypothetical protein